MLIVCCVLKGKMKRFLKHRNIHTEEHNKNSIWKKGSKEARSEAISSSMVKAFHDRISEFKEYKKEHKTITVKKDIAPGLCQ